ncbi:MAG: hypothetical protein LBS37_04320 [Treponema sp.]|jgi:hypothetical protein|nr:hypothetical protein [Treponema sp.]
MKIIPLRGIPEPYHSGSQAQAAPAASAAKTAAARLSPPGPCSPAALLKSLGLPADRLSGSIVSFARFFSLPLERDFLARVRREVRLTEKAPRAGREAGKAPAGPRAEAEFSGNREALSLAAIAAADKGAELSRAGLAEYASAIDPDGQGGEHDGGEGASGQNAGGDGRRTDDGDFEGAPAAALDLTERLLESAACNPVLNLLNRLPGKNGRRWIVLPLSFVEQGLLYRLSLRILLDADGARGRAAAHLILEIAAGPAGTGPERRWSFSMEREPEHQTRLRARFWPPAAAKTPQSLAGELAAFMGLPPESVSVENCAESFPLTENNGYTVLRSINEAV